MTAGHQNHTLLGAFYMALGVFIFTSVNVVVKEATTSYPILQIVFFRFAFSILPCLFLLKKAGGFSALKTDDLKIQLFSGVIGVVGLYCLFQSFASLPLADATALTYASILFVTLLSVPLLKEKVGLPRWIAVLIGFAGIIVMTNPSGEILQTGVFYGLAFALIDGLVILLARLLTKRNHPASIVFYFVITATVVSGCFLPFGHWRTPDSLLHWGLLILLGLGGGTGQICLTHAMRYAPATVLAPVGYTSFVWSLIFGMLVWGDFPTLEVWIGCGVLILCGLFITFHARFKDLNGQNIAESL